MDKRKLGLIICHHCQKKFKGNEKVIVVSLNCWNATPSYKRYFKEESIVSEYALLGIPVNIKFHRECFNEIAGKEYSL